jgi:hypothetical protein
MKHYMFIAALTITGIVSLIHTEHPVSKTARNQVGTLVSENLDYQLTLIEWVIFNPDRLPIDRYFRFHGKPLPQ